MVMVVIATLGVCCIMAIVSRGALVNIDNIIGSYVQGHSEAHPAMTS
jgi:hypothetical protein